ncbi:MAG: SIMPL domain-containing protein [Armatimonadetes bacterium]|nr:SIMPL domain-containing protein [Armatimonadota bacterium]
MLSRSRGAMLALVGALVLVSRGSAGAQAADLYDPNRNILTVSGTGEVRVVPNEAVVRLGVETRAPRAAEAIQENNRLMTQVVAAIRKADVPERNIQTATFNVSRQLEPEPENPRRTRAVYVVTNVVTVRLEDVTRVGTVLDAATEAGANTVYGLDFVSAREIEARQEALREAVSDARRKADIIANAARIEITGVESIVESSPPVGIPRPFGVAAAERIQTPISPGENVIQASVQVRYRIRTRD